jgi:hypothetical protein
MEPDLIGSKKANMAHREAIPVQCEEISRFDDLDIQSEETSWNKPFLKVLMFFL